MANGKKHSWPESRDTFWKVTVVIKLSFCTHVTHLFSLHNIFHGVCSDLPWFSKTRRRELTCSARKIGMKQWHKMKVLWPLWQAFKPLHPAFIPVGNEVPLEGGLPSSWVCIQQKGNEEKFVTWFKSLEDIALFSRVPDVKGSNSGTSSGGPIIGNVHAISGGSLPAPLLWRKWSLKHKSCWQF